MDDIVDLENELDNDLEIEVVDDTPEVDRKRKPLKEPVVDPTEDELSTYDEKVQKRIKMAHRKMHDERRAKEAAQREKDEALAFAQRMMAKSKELETQLSEGSKVYIEKAKSEADFALEAAKREFKEAYEAGDADKLAEAQEKIAEATTLRYNAKSLKPLTPQEETVYTEDKKTTNLPKPSARDEEWLEDNQWFDVHSPDYDSAMYGAALGVHNKLASSGMSVGSKEYYDSINGHMRKMFPDYFGSESEEEEETPKKTKPSTVVAPAKRGHAPNKIKLSQSQVNIAKRLGLTPEQYALAMINMKGEE